MHERDFAAWLDRFGPDLPRWSDAALRRSAERLLAASAEARAMLSRATRLAALIGAVATPPPPPLAAIVERATAQPQVTARRAARSPTRALPVWLGLGRWHVVAFASCLVIGIVVGVRSAVPSQTSYAIYDMVDGSVVEDLHE
jgi:hypothetical protein